MHRGETMIPLNELTTQITIHLKNPIHKRNGSIDADCPFCGKPAKTGKFNFNPYPKKAGRSESGVYKCFSCDSSGSGKELLDKLSGGNIIQIDPEFTKLIEKQRKEAEKKAGEIERYNHNTKNFHYDYINPFTREKEFQKVVYYTNQIGKKGKRKKKSFWTAYKDGILYKSLFDKKVNYCYNLHKISSDTVLIFEGEKKSEYVQRFTNHSCISYPGGSNYRLTETDIQFLRGKRVFIFPDYDSKGNNYKGQICSTENYKILRSKNIDCHIIDLREKANIRFAGYDIEDYLKECPGIESDILETLLYDYNPINTLNFIRSFYHKDLKNDPSIFKDHYLRIPDKFVSWIPLIPRIIVNKSFYGAGKTYSIINECKLYGTKFVVIQPTRSLICDTKETMNKEGIDSKTHLDLIKKNIFESYIENLITTLESLIKKDPCELKDFLFVFDEFVTILNQIHSHIDNSIREKIYDYLIYIFKNCRVLVYDTGIEDHEIELIMSLSGESMGSKDFLIIENTYYQIPEREVTIFKNENSFDLKIKESIQSNHSIYLPCDNVSYSEKLSKELNEIGIKNLDSLTSESRAEILKENTIDSHIENNDLNYLSISPTGFSGLNIRDKFDSIYLKCFGVINDYRGYTQSIHRERNFGIPLNINCKRINYDPFLKTDYNEILKESEKQSSRGNFYMEKRLNKEGFYSFPEKYKPFLVFLAKREAYLNKQKLDGIENFLINFYKKYNIKVKLNSEEAEKPVKEKEQTSSREEKRALLKSIELIDKIEYSKLKLKRSYEDLTKEETAKLETFELSEKLNISYTGIERKEVLNSVYDFSVNENRLNGLAERISILHKSDFELYEKEKNDYLSSGIVLKPKSLLLEKKLLLDLLQYRDRDFSKLDFDSSIIEEIGIITGTNPGELHNDSYLNRESVKEVFYRTGDLSKTLDICSKISKGDIETIESFYKDKLERIEEKENISLKEKLAKIDTIPDFIESKITTFINKKGQERKRTVKEKNNIEKKRELRKEAEEVSRVRKQIKKNSFILDIQFKFSISPIDSISDFLKNWGISLEETSKSGNKRTYRMNLTLFDRLSGNLDTKTFKNTNNIEFFVSKKVG